MIHVYHEIVKEALRELADEALQTRLWTSSGEPYVSSLTEAKSQLWDDSGLGYAMDRGVVYNDDIDAQLKHLHGVLAEIDENTPVRTLLASPQLAVVRSLANKVLDSLTGY